MRNCVLICRASMWVGGF